MKTRLSMLAALLLCLAPGYSRAELPPEPSSIGFKDPADAASLGALLGYRLPDWGYRTTTLSLNSSGNGTNYESRDEGSATASESIVHRRFRESERRAWSFRARQDGRWTWTQQALSMDRRIDGQLNASLDFGGDWRHFLSDRVSLIVSTSVNGAYVESRVRQGADRQVGVDRTSSSSSQLGAGLGRLRDVTPMLVALRIGERLQALGREPLSTEVATRLAEMLARQQGYSAVFDRGSRRFWRDTLAPLAGAPLAPYEVYYLQEATFEELGSRREGYRADAGIQLYTVSRVNQLPKVGTGPWLAGAWSHNLGLDHQLSAEFDSRYLVYARRDGNNPYSEHQAGQATLTGSYLWVVADRVSWKNSLGGSALYSRTGGPGYITRQQSLSLISACTFYIEDRLRLSPWASGTWTHRSSAFARLSDIREWRFQLSLNYRLGGGLP